MLTPSFNRFSSAWPTLAILAGMLCLTLGCGQSDGPELGYVEGVVTLDGEPLEGAEVVFEPPDGAPSSATTDAQGRYVLDFTATQQGALVGQHGVRIRSARPASGGEGSEPLVTARKELLPPKYHQQSELTANVTSGNNTIDFALESK